MTHSGDIPSSCLPLSSHTHIYCSPLKAQWGLLALSKCRTLYPHLSDYVSLRGSPPHLKTGSRRFLPLSSGFGSKRNQRASKFACSQCSNRLTAAKPAESGLNILKIIFFYSFHVGSSSPPRRIPRLYHLEMLHGTDAKALISEFDRQPMQKLQLHSHI